MHKHRKHSLAARLVSDHGQHWRAVKPIAYGLGGALRQEVRQAHAKHAFDLAIQGRRQVRRGQAGDLPDCCGASLLGSSRQAGLRLSEERSQEVGPLGFLAFGGLRSAWRHANVEITKDLGARFRRFPAFSGVRFRFSFSGFRSPVSVLRFSVCRFP